MTDLLQELKDKHCQMEFRWQKSLIADGNEKKTISKLKFCYFKGIATFDLTYETNLYAELS